MQPQDAAQQGGTRWQQVQSTKKENKVLAVKSTSLKEKLAKKEQERKNLVKEQSSLVSNVFIIKCQVDNLVKDLESTRTRLQDKVEEVRFLNEHLYSQQIETEKLKEQLKAECDKISEMDLSFKKTIKDLNAEWICQWIAREKELAAELKLLQDDCEKMRHVIQEKNEEISTIRTEIVTLADQMLENVAMVNTAKAQIHQTEKEWQVKFKALEDLVCERAEKEDSCKKTEELQNESRKVEEKEWIQEESKTEEDMRPLIQQNIKLKETALKSDKRKAKMKKEEEKTKKDAEKRMKKEMKEREKKDKKEKKEREEKEKREKKEKEKKEREEKEKREKKKKEKEEREEKEKREKKEKEKEEREEREKREKKEKEKEEREEKEKREKKEKEKEDKREKKDTALPLSLPSPSTPVPLYPSPLPLASHPSIYPSLSIFH
ncbi:hypothetical protein Q5P01_019219 [Channa striata]|uniref:Uncharacterized protein n=1 Tax=Channa striata TaxID=64152 RepID=A0AA88M137_CHASR|nr:hypothetical protein Q5P01_019219 [Channa striata]